MITTFKAMRSSLAKTLIIGLALVWLGGCSALRLGYDNGPMLASLWLDRYLDLDRAQDAALRPALDDWFAWHRRTQLPEYSQALGALAAQAGGPVSAEQICVWNDEWRARLDTAIERALPAAADLLPRVSEAQWRHLERHYAKRSAERREEMAPADPAQRARATFKRYEERAESFYGSLDDAQRRLLKDALASSPLDSGSWLDEREARQRDLLRTLKALQREDAPMARRVEVMRALAQRFAVSPDPAYRAFQARYTQFNCQLAAQLHQSTSAGQREHLRGKLAGWNDDLRALAASARVPVQAAQAAPPQSAQ